VVWWAAIAVWKSLVRVETVDLVGFVGLYLSEWQERKARQQVKLRELANREAIKR
jgi:hypothetical protein